jgi:hypothetical protein
MLKLLTSRCCRLTAVVALLLLAASSATPAAALRHERTHAARHQATHRRHKAGRQSRASTVLPAAKSSSTTPALLGDEAVESSRDYLAAGQAEAFRFQALSSGTTGAVHLYLDSHNSAGTIVVGLYSNAGSHPGSLLTTGSGPSSSAGTWTTVSVAPSQLTAGTTYWLAVLGRGGTLRYRDRGRGSCPSQTSAQTNLGGLPASWTTGEAYADCPVSAYVTPATAVEQPPVEPPPVESPPPPPAAPVDSTPPAISGTPMEGKTLTTTTGSWAGNPTTYAYQWRDCDALGEGCLNIGGATTASHTLQPLDVGNAVRVVVTATNTGGSTPASSAATETVSPVPPPPPPPAPTNTALPTITGTTTEGQTLSASKGTWTGSPTSYTYQWQDCNTLGENCANASGATTASYTLSANDVGHTIRVIVAASNEAGSTPATSAASATVSAIPPPPPPPAPTNTALPTITGTTTEGQTLSASKGTWSGSPTSYTYQWQDCNTLGASCSNTNGATTTSYKLSASDVGHTIRVVVTATNEGGSTPATSAASATVAAIPPPPPPTASFTFSPTSPVAGQQVTFDGTASTCSDAPCTYEWSDDGSTTRPIPPLWPLGSGQTLLFTFSEASTKYVRLVVTDAASQTATVEHNVVVKASTPAPPTNSSLPTISGTATQGDALTASTGTWTGSPTSYTYQWQDCNTSGESCSNVSGATKASYTLGAGDVGDTIRVVVTATNEGGSTPATSAATETVAAESEPPPPPPAPANTIPPAIGGTATQGLTLNATTGTWTGSPTGYAYQWRDCNTSGEGCSNVSGATANSYTLGAGDVGHTIRVVVTASNEGGATPASSTQTAIVAEASSGGSCTATISSVSQINAALTPGAVVCLAAGTYGAVGITTSPSSNATLTAAPGAHVVVGGVNIAASNITVSQLHSTGTINVGAGSPYPGFSHDVIEHNDVGPTNGYGISVMSATSTPSSYITIANNRIHDTSATNEGDALRFDGWSHITVTGNDIYKIKECPGSTCHTDTLQSYNSGVPTTGLTITKNYTHDNVGAQGLPFLKDGDISNVLISDNLSVRNTNTNGQVTGVWVDENIAGLTITKNTYQGTSGSIVQADGSATGPTVAINHNVFDNLNVRPGSGPSYTTTEDYDIFTGNDQYTFNLGPHSSLNSNPGFINTATDDYRLANNPNGIGIDWSPAEEQYGPTN